MKLKSLLILVAVFTAYSMTGENPDAIIKIDTVDNALQVNALYSDFSDASTELKYELNCIKSGKSGKSNTNQSGMFKTGLKDTVELSKVSINLTNGDKLNVELLIFLNDSVIDEQKKSLIINEAF